MTIEDVRALTAGLPRSYEAVVRGRVKFRVGSIVYLAWRMVVPKKLAVLSDDELLQGAVDR